MKRRERRQVTLFTCSLNLMAWELHVIHPTARTWSKVMFFFFFKIINWTWSKVFKCRSEIWIWVLWPLWVVSIVCTSSTITNLYSLGIHSKLCPNLYQFINIFFFIRVNNCTCTSLYVVNDYVMFVVYFRTVICKCVLQSWKYTGKTILCISSLN